VLQDTVMFNETVKENIRFRKTRCNRWRNRRSC
jgi:ABC-type multidrug transport system fused ATPase/permease subunit